MAIDIEKAKKSIERRTKLQQYLEEFKYSDEELDELMQWEEKRERSVLFAQLKALSFMPVKELDNDGKLINGLVSFDDYPAYQEKQKQEALARKEANKRPKDPQAVRSKAENAYSKKVVAYNKVLQSYAEAPSTEKELRLVVAKAQMNLAHYLYDKALDKLVEVFGLKDRQELGSIPDLTVLVEEE